MQIVENAPAKINLWLRILEKRPDGYHNIETVFQTISLADCLTLSLEAKDISLSSDNPRLPTDENNLAVRAAQLLAAQISKPRGVHIYLEKRIPWRAGLGGGSSDAAAVLRGLNKLWGLHWPLERLIPLARSLGADVPFFLYGGTALGLGRGDELRPLAISPRFSLVLIQPPFGLATPRVYEAWRPHTEAVSSDPTALLKALEEEDQASFVSLLRNDLEEPAFLLAPVLAAVKEKILATGHACLLSGSGSCLLVIPRQGAAVPATLNQVRSLLPCDFRACLVNTVGL